MRTEESRIALPERPAELAGASVAAWHEAVVIDTYAPEQPDRYPAFGPPVYHTVGQVPLPFYKRISRTSARSSMGCSPSEERHRAVDDLASPRWQDPHRLDKTTGTTSSAPTTRSPAQSTTGPDAGVRFNPQHHRPAAYLPATS
jgi:hypothetical protein